MLNKIIEFSIKNKLIVGLFTITLLFYGIYEITKLPIDAVPDITNNQVQVITVTPSLGAPDVERLITFPIEQANSNISGLKEIRSFSRFGLSLVTITRSLLFAAIDAITGRLARSRSPPQPKTVINFPPAGSAGRSARKTFRSASSVWA